MPDEPPSSPTAADLQSHFARQAQDQADENARRARLSPVRGLALACNETNWALYYAPERCGLVFSQWVASIDFEDYIDQWVHEAIHPLVEALRDLRAHGEADAVEFVVGFTGHKSDETRTRIRAYMRAKMQNLVVTEDLEPAEQELTQELRDIADASNFRLLHEQFDLIAHAIQVVIDGDDWKSPKENARKKRGSRRGRRQQYDPNEDARLAEKKRARNLTNLELAQEVGISPRKVKLAIDRDRKRKRRTKR